jgi:hypothetical protein
LPAMNPDRIMKAAAGAAAAWSSVTFACTSMHIQVERRTGPGGRGGAAVVFHTKDWCRQDGVKCTPYDPASPAITSISANKGVITIATIDVNARDFSWADLSLESDRAGSAYDLQNTLTAQIGHVLGFDSSCVPAARSGMTLLDDAGQAVPACEAASAAIQETTMFDPVLAGETKKRTLDRDDRNAVCDTYPSTPANADGSSPQASCVGDVAPTDSGGGCRAGAGRPQTTGAWISALMLLFFLTTRRRAHRRVRPESM